MKMWHSHPAWMPGLLVSPLLASTGCIVQCCLNKSLILNIFDNGFDICITNASIKFTWAPEMSTWISFSKIWFLFEQFTSWCTLQQMECLRYAHCWWNRHGCMGMISHDTQFIYCNVMPWSNILQNVFAKVFMLLLSKHIVPILRTPF